MGGWGHIGVLAIPPLPSDHISKLCFFIKASWIEIENKANAKRRKKGAGENVGLGTRWVSSTARREEITKCLRVAIATPEQKGNSRQGKFGKRPIEFASFSCQTSPS